MRRLIAAAVIAASAAAPALATTTSGPRTHLSEKRIRQIALTAARAAGDPRPTSITHAEGTRARVNAVDSGDRVAGNAPSVLIVERGHFVLTNVPIPLGAKPPHGSILSLVVDARSGRITDEGVSDHAPDLRRLGRVTTDLAPLARAVTVPTLACPAREPGRLPRPSWPAARHELAPPEATAVTVCRYAGLNAQPRLGLVSSRLITKRAAIRKLVAGLDALPPFPRGAVSCPADDGSAVLLRLRYPARSLEVSVALTGCRVARNGSVIRLASPSVLGELTAAQAAHRVRASLS